MTDPTMLARRYLALWNEGDDAARRQHLAEGWNKDARYADPMMGGEGHEGTAEMIANARASFPGHEFALRGTPDGHGDVVRFSWTLAPAGGAAVARGTDVVRLDADGRITEVIGFLDGDSA